MKASDLVSGIPKRKAKKNAEIAESYYKLGRTAAALEREKEQNKQEAQLNILQKIALQELMMKIKEMSLELDAKQALAMQKNSAPYPPMPPEIGYPGGIPKLPMPPPGMPPPLPIDMPPDYGGVPMAATPETVMMPVGGGPMPYGGEIELGPAPPMM